MRQGITTRYLGPTNSRGSRIKATARKASAHGAEMAATVHYDHALNIGGNHTAAAQALATKLGWSGLWIAGGKPEEDGNMYVCVGPDLDLRNVASAKAGAWGVEGEDWFYV